MPKLTAILALLVACAARPAPPVVAPPSAVPLSVWVVRDLRQTWWLAPAQLYAGSFQGPTWDDGRWRCLPVAPRWQ